MSTPILSRAPRWYRERAGLEPTHRGPAPRLYPNANPINAYPTAPPLPLPATALPSQGDPPPDRGLSDAWPLGVAAEAAP